MGATANSPEHMQSGDVGGARWRGGTDGEGRTGIGAVWFPGRCCVVVCAGSAPSCRRSRCSRGGARATHVLVGRQQAGQSTHTQSNDAGVVGQRRATSTAGEAVLLAAAGTQANGVKVGGCPVVRRGVTVVAGGRLGSRTWAGGRHVPDVGRRCRGGRSRAHAHKGRQTSRARGAAPGGRPYLLVRRRLGVGHEGRSRGSAGWAETADGHIPPGATVAEQHNGTET